MKDPLDAMTLNEKECKHIMQPIVNFGATKDVISSTLIHWSDMGLVISKELGFLTPLLSKEQAE